MGSFKYLNRFLLAAGIGLISVNCSEFQPVNSSGTSVFSSYSGELDGDPVPVDVIVEGTENSTVTLAVAAIDGYTTHAVDEASEFQVQYIDNITLLATGTIPNLTVNDIIVGTTADGQRGVLKKVVSVLGASITVAPATLEEAFPNMDLNLNIRVLNEGNAARVLEQEALQTQAANQKIRTQAEFDLFNADRRFSTDFGTGGVIYSKGGVNFNSALSSTLDISIIGRRVEEFSAVATAAYRSDIEFGAELQVEDEKEDKIDLNPLFTKTVKFTVGGVPIFLNIEMVPVIGYQVNFSSGGSVKYGYDISANTRTGFMYANEAFTLVDEANYNTTSIGPEVQINGGATAEGNASLALAISLYDVEKDIPVLGRFEFEGPGIGVDLGAKGKFSISSSYDSANNPALTCNVNLKIGLESHLEADYGSIGSTVGVNNPGSLLIYENYNVLYNSDDCPFDGAPLGNLEGVVSDAAGAALADVTVTIKNMDGVDVATTVTDLNGAYNIVDLVAGPYTAEFSKATYNTAVASVEVKANLSTPLPETLVLTETEAQGTGPWAFLVADSQAPDNIISGAQIILRKGLDSPSGEYVSQHYSELNVSQTVNLQAGHYTLEVRANGFDRAYQNLTVVSGAPVLSEIFLSRTAIRAPSSNGGEARVVLTWGENPSDLDSHMINNQSHIFYGFRETPQMRLDVDDVTSFGPETITVDSVNTQPYLYYVHHFAGIGDIPTSNAQVQLFYQGVVRTYSPPQGVGRYWKVFEILNGQVVPCSENCLTDVNPLTETGISNGLFKLQQLPQKLYTTDQ